LIDESNYRNSEDKERVKLRKEMLVQSKLEHCSVIGSYLELQILDLNLVYMDRKLRHRPKIFMGVQDPIMLYGSSNLSNNGEVRICPATPTLFSVQPMSRVLEVQMTSFLFCWKAETIPQNFHEDNLFKI
jgi:MoaA/NifB/PqqE/SkfB family radical SAM enzyme